MYLAKLIFQMPQNKSTKFMDTVIFTLYNYASNQREEYLLLKLFKTALEEEIKYVLLLQNFSYLTNSSVYLSCLNNSNLVNFFSCCKTMYICNLSYFQFKKEIISVVENIFYRVT